MFCPLASGSKGNALFVGSDKTRLLIDAGLSIAQIEERLLQIDVDPKTIEAILITHEHSDHIKSAASFSEKFRIPILANIGTAKAMVKALGQKPKFKIFTTGEPFQFGDMNILPFSVPHDAADPVAFTIQIKEIKLGVCADLGHATSLVKKVLAGCDYLYLEANHHPAMVHSSNRPAYLKERILGRQGHLSNQDAAKLLSELHHAGLKHVYLAHLSSECNVPEVAMETVMGILKEKGLEVSMSIAWQDRVSDPIAVTNC
jgi:phosphoribosyl 1,2-cyclic phosphodiesterase